MIDLLFLADKHEEWMQVASALKSLSSDGMVLPVEDRQNFEVLIEEYFDASDDDTGSEDEQVATLPACLKPMYILLFVV